MKFDSADLKREKLKRIIDVDVLKPTDERPRTNSNPSFLKLLFRQQKAFVEDPARFKALLSSRHAGKTYSACAILTKEALAHEKVDCLYMAVSREKAEELIWQELKEFNRKFSLGFKFNDVKLIATNIRTKSRIYLRGFDSKKEKEKPRGGRYRVIIIDEAQMIGKPLADFVNQSLGPALASTKGSLILLGTPDGIPFGMFFDITFGSNVQNVVEENFGWRVYKWTALENPHIPDEAGERKLTLLRNGWTEENPAYQREWLGLWTLRHNLLAFRFEKTRNTIDHIPSDLTFSMGLDLGFNDATAIVIAGTRVEDPNFYIVDCFQSSNLSPSQAAEIVEGYKTKWNCAKMIGDSSGLGKGYLEEYRTRYGVSIIPVNKHKNRKLSIDALSDDFETGKIKIYNDKENDGLQLLIQQFSTLQYKDQVGYVFDPSTPDHGADATRYLHTSTLPARFRQPKHLSAEEINQQIEKDILACFLKPSARNWQETVSTNLRSKKY